jgi:hypothetical protein
MCSAENSFFPHTESVFDFLDRQVVVNSKCYSGTNTLGSFSQTTCSLSHQTGIYGWCFQTARHRLGSEFIWDLPSLLNSTAFDVSFAGTLQFGYTPRLEFHL